MDMLAMAILVHFWVPYWTTEPATYMHPKVQPSALQCSLATRRMLGLRVLGQSDGNSGSCMARLCALTTYKPAHGHGHGHDRGLGKKKLRELRHKGSCCCFEWAMYAHAPCACYAAIWALYNPKPPKCGGGSFINSTTV